MCFDGTGARLLTASLDNHVKVYDIAQYKVTHSMDFGAPILSMGLSPDNTTLAVGMADGTLTVRKRRSLSQQAAASEKKQQQIARGGSFRYFLRGANRKPPADEFCVEKRRRRRLQPYDKFLLKFQYAEALDAALETKAPPVIIAVMEELRQRDALVAACGARDDQEVMPLLAFVGQYVTHPRYASFLLDIAGMLLDLYGPVLGQSASIDELFFKMHAKVNAEVEFVKQLYPLQGILELLMANSAA
jgi:U3 small nucleolar RNA-associated protein 15